MDAVSNMMWETIATERPGVWEIDKTFIRTNEDGTKERIRFVKYPWSIDGTVEKFCLKMKESKITFGEIFGTDETEFTWDVENSTTETISIKDFTIFGNHSHRVELLLKTLIDLCNDSI